MILYPFRLIFAVWVEISARLHCDSLPFSADFRCLGRDFPKANPGISTLSTDFCCLGRDFLQATSGISTFSADFLCLGRDFRAVAL